MSDGISNKMISVLQDAKFGSKGYHGDSLQLNITKIFDAQL